MIGGFGQCRPIKDNLTPAFLVTVQALQDCSLYCVGNKIGLLLYA